MTSTAVGVVVVNWNGHADTMICLESLMAADPRPARVAVVDNGSTDRSVETLLRWRANRALPVALLASSTNRGFSAANNIGIARLAADRAISHFLLLNNDASVHPAFFAQLARALVAAPDAAVIGPTIYVTGRPGEVWYAGGYVVPLRALVAHEYVVPQQSAPVPTQFVTGCAMVISRSGWETLGPLPECYFMYLEDAEYSYRARAAGLPVVYAPQAVAYHAVGNTIRFSHSTPWVERLKARNRVLFVRRNFRGWNRWSALTYLAVTKPGRAAAEVLRGRPALGWAILDGTIEGLLSSHGDREARQAATVQDPADRVLVYE